MSFGTFCQHDYFWSPAGESFYNRTLKWLIWLLASKVIKETDWRWLNPAFLGLPQENVWVQIELWGFHFLFIMEVTSWKAKPGCARCCRTITGLSSVLYFHGNTLQCHITFLPAWSQFFPEPIKSWESWNESKNRKFCIPSSVIILFFLVFLIRNSKHRLVTVMSVRSMKETSTCFRIWKNI